MQEETKVITSVIFLIRTLILFCLYSTLPLQMELKYLFWWLEILGDHAEVPATMVLLNLQIHSGLRLWSVRYYLVSILSLMGKIMEFLLFLLQILLHALLIIRLGITWTIKDIKLLTMMKIMHQVICIHTLIKYLQQQQICSLCIFLLHHTVERLFLLPVILLANQCQLFI